MKLIRNRAKCRNCGDIIESKHRHDFVSCSCMIEFEEKCRQYQYDNIEATHVEVCRFAARHCKGISIDGGLEYSKQSFMNPNDIIDLREYE